MRQAITWLIVICALMVLAGAASAANVTLVKDGQAQCAIFVAPAVMAPDSKEQLKNPARENEVQRQRLRESVNDLALYLEKISGAKVDIVQGEPPAGDKRVPILVGDLATKQFGEVGKTYPYKQAFRLVVSRKGVGLSGESDLATSYAIYELLDRLGCRWYMPSELGEEIPQLKTIAVANMDEKLAPGTLYRSIIYSGAAYARRNRYGGLPLHAGQTLELGYYVSKDEIQKHPEWQGVGKDGKPLPVEGGYFRFKWSNKELANTIADKILSQYADDPQPSYSLSPADGVDFDQSAEDKALDAGDYDPIFQSDSLTDRLMVFCNRIAERVTAKQPDVFLGVLAYVQFNRPPVREKVHANVIPQIAPITYARAHPMSDDRVPNNPALRNIVEGWAKKASMTSYYFFAYYLAEVTAPNPMLTKWGHDVPYVLSKGNCKFWQPETMPNFETHLYALYMGGRLAFNPSLKPQDVYKEIDERFYGNAAKEMSAYWRFVDNVWVSTPEFSGCGFNYLRFWSPDNLKKARGLMNAALAAAKTAKEKFRVGMADDSLKLFELFMKLRYDQAEGRFANLATEADTWLKEVLDLGEKYKDQYAFTKVGWTPHTIGGLYFKCFYEATYRDAARIANTCQILTPKPLRSFKYLADPEKKGEAAGYAKPEFDDENWKTTDVCMDTWSTLGYHDYFKSMWYRTSVELPAVPAGKKVFLWIGSTDGSAKLFVNGQHIPYVQVTEQPDKTMKSETKEEPNGYCQPFSFDITAVVKPGVASQVSILCTRTFFNELGTGGLLAPVLVYSEK